MSFIDISKELEGIRERYQLRVCSGDAQERGLNYTGRLNGAEDKAAALWGFTTSHRTVEAERWHKYDFDCIEEFNIKTKEMPWSMNDIRIGKSPTGLWAVTVGYSIFDSGFGGCMSVWLDKQYMDRESAIEAGFDEWFRGIKSIAGDRISNPKVKI